MPPSSSPEEERHALIDTHMHQTLNTKNFEYLKPYHLRQDSPLLLRTELRSQVGPVDGGGGQITMNRYKKRIKILVFPPWVIETKRLALGEVSAPRSTNKERAPMTRSIIE